MRRTARCAYGVTDETGFETVSTPSNRAVPFPNRGGNVHGRGFFILGIVARAARAIFSPQCPCHVAPIRVIGADGLAFGIVDDGALGVRNIDPQVDRLLVHA